ncbi:hypothetical protein KNJ79_08105 [Sphingopyxis indica]|uniref:hypothetical protein n=1 Tax=Sphingopyxis indica TaxID=436663 RepID=UPI002938E066|nr:hypothetical protein [Sphingopyxis indica]WOF44836.1 hypothetical protein KNJ79_08105 [Sphingopyxis indica]
MNNTHLIWIFALGFPLFFVAMWLFIARILSWAGWSKFLPAFAWDRPVPDHVRRHSLATMVIGRFPGGVSYRNAVSVWIDERGFYLRPMILFRLFHPLLHIGWDQVASIEPRKTLWIKAHQLSFRRDVPMLTFGGSAGQSLFDAWQARNGGRPG